MPKLILFNGPRHSGKDTACNYLEATWHNIYNFKMSAPIKAGIKGMFNLTDVQVNYLESIKTEPTPLLGGRSYVECQISFSETWAKHFFGKSIFGDLAARRIYRDDISDDTICVCSDSGFVEEVDPVLKIIGKQNTLLVHIFRDGKTYEGDSRSYIKLPGVTTVEVTNNGSVPDYLKAVEHIVSEFTNDRQDLLPKSRLLNS